MKRSKHSLSNYKLLSCDMGQLVPVNLTEVLPGDSIQQATTALVRVSPLLAPIMHPVHMRIHHWFVPHRLVWNDWENFITGGAYGSTPPTFPTVTSPGGGYAVSSLADYLGVPTGVAALGLSALPFRGYQLIWNEWYRDQDLETAATIDLTDGADTTTTMAIQNVDWEKDYFTTARPWPQKGATVTIPLEGQANVVRKTNATAWGVYQSGGNTPAGNTDVKSNTGSLLANTADATTLSLDPDGQLYAALDTLTANGGDINTLRQLFALQRYGEARARYGSRYTEYLRYLGVHSSDARLQRPEYLGGGKQTLQFSEVLQTGVAVDSEDETVGAVGDLAGHGIGALRSNRYRRFFEEHGYIFSLLSVKPKTVYSNGLPRTFNRRTKEDFFQKELEYIGQQEVKNKEVYWAAAAPESTFGYQDRYDEYRRQESQVAGEFKSTLNYWHYARIFASEPTLNADFVRSAPTTRVYADSTSDQLYVMVSNSIQARRIVGHGGESFVR